MIISHSAINQELKYGLGFPYWVDMAVPIFMMISGYLLTKSYMMRNLYKLEDLYDAKVMTRKIRRFIIPSKIDVQH